MLISNDHRGTVIEPSGDPLHHLESHHVALPAELADQIAELIVRAPGPGGRAAVIAAIVTELHGLVAWAQPTSHAAGEELEATQRMVTAAHAHLQVMQADQRVGS